jgi:histidinol-phosphatase (PHP family)
MITTDYHLHTHFSHDSQTSPAAVCQAAVDRGLTEICFTEHLDFDPTEPDYVKLDWPAYAEAVDEARAHYAGRLTVRIGVEFDFRREYGARVGEVVTRLPADFMIGSVHFAAGHRLYRLRKGVPAGFDVRAVLTEYFAEVEALVATGWCNSLGHFEYLYKQIPAIVGPVRDDWYWQKVEGILRQCIASGIGIEANMHHTLEGCAMAADVEVLRRYRALGGRLVTVGSDAHRLEDVAGDFVRAEEALRQAGFDAVCGYEGGRPYFLPLGKRGMV